MTTLSSLLLWFTTLFGPVQPPADNHDTWRGSENPHEQTTQRAMRRDTPQSDGTTISNGF